MRDVLTESGRRVTLGQRIGSGGEGAVYEVGSDHVAKIYHKAPDADRINKLRLLVQRARASILKVAAWPDEVLLDATGRRVIGFVMPRVNGRHEVYKLYTPVSRKLAFPSADFRFLVYAARNLAIAVSEVHQAGAVIGDLNERNVLVGDDARVVLIDCDSFQVHDNGRVFRCPVGQPNYTAPELQGTPFADVDRSPESDAFALAILVFQLLFLARYPFVTALLDGGEVAIEDAIRRYLFAWAPDASHRGVAPPPQAIPLNIAGPVSNLFVDAFSAHRRRPVPADWLVALSELERGLTKCPRSEGHTYAKQLSSCPWCRLIAAGVADPFITITIRTASLASWPVGADLEVLIRQIENLPRPSPVESLLKSSMRRMAPRPFVAPPPIGAAPASMPGWVWGAVVLAAVVSLLSDEELRPYFLSATGLGLIVVVCVATSLSRGVGAYLQIQKNRSDTIARERESRVRAETMAKSNYELAVAAVLKQNRLMEERRRAFLDEVRSARAELEKLAGSLPERLNQMQKELVELQRTDYLEGFDIESAVISHFPRPLKKTLKNYGIYSAADIAWQRLLSIPGVADGRRTQLLNWRASLDANFRPDPNRRLTDQDRQRAVLGISQEREARAQKIRTKATEFQKEYQSELVNDGRLRAVMVQSSHALAQAKEDSGLMQAIT